jgi:cell division protein FtsI (penicillin-binding protein 3)
VFANGQTGAEAQSDMEPVPPLTKSQERAMIVGLILLGWALIVVFRLFMLQVVQHEELASLAKRQQERLEPIDAPRGSIFDRNGNLLAISSTAHVAVVNPKRIPNKGLAAALLARILELDAQKLELYLDRAASSRTHGGYFVVDNHITDEQAAGLQAMNLDWLEIRQGSVRTYPNGEVAAHVIGNVDSEGRGVSGVELKLNKDLSGSPGSRRLERDGKAVAYASEIVKNPVIGKSIGLTIDTELQYIAQEALKAAVLENHADHGSLVAMDPRTGAVLALENYPTFDPNQHLLPGEKSPGREDLAVGTPFEPGSVFKIVTLAAALETTRLTPNSLIDCGHGVMRLYTRVIHDSHPHGMLSLQDVLAFSSNIGAIRIGMQVGNQNLYEYVRRFGFGHRTGIELPAEAPGILRPLRRWQPTSIGSVPMGHEIGVTSLQLAQMGSVIANGGSLVHPHVVAWEQIPNGPREAVTHPVPVQILRPETVMQMRMMMQRVMTEPHGTGHRLHVIGYTVGGKTGTAQIYDYAHHVYTHRYNASFLGFAPATNPSLVVVVTVSGTTGEAGFGGSAAGPVFVRLMTSALTRLGVMRDVPQEIDDLLAKRKESKQDIEDRLQEEKETDAAEELSAPLTAEEMQEAQGAVAPAENLASNDPNAPKVPNFVGKTVRDVMQEAAAEGIDIDMAGDGMARAQNPAPGAALIPGERVQVRFAR